MHLPLQLNDFCQKNTLLINGLGIFVRDIVAVLFCTFSYFYLLVYLILMIKDPICDDSLIMAHFYLTSHS